MTPYSNQPYIGLPRVSSENRKFIPIGFLDGTVAGDKLYVLMGGTLYHFAILSSSMHNAFMRLVAGRMKSYSSYSNTIVYNNFPYPFPPMITTKKPTPHEMTSARQVKPYSMPVSITDKKTQNQP